MFGKNSKPPGGANDAVRGKRTFARMQLKTIPLDQAHQEQFKIGWDVPQDNRRANSQITGKVGQTLKEEDQYDTLQKQIYLQQQNQAQYKQLAVKNQTSNIFAQQVPQEQPNEVKNYGNFYAGMPPTGPKSKINQQEEEAQNHKGYGILFQYLSPLLIGNFYTKNSQGAYHNVPRPAQSMKQQYVYQ